MVFLRLLERNDLPEFVPGGVLGDSSSEIPLLSFGPNFVPTTFGGLLERNTRKDKRGPNALLLLFKRAQYVFVPGALPARFWQLPGSIQGSPG